MLPEDPVRVLLLRANDLGFAVENLEQNLGAKSQ
jgi:hypothetical protein